MNIQRITDIILSVLLALIIIVPCAIMLLYFIREMWRALMDD